MRKLVLLSVCLGLLILCGCGAGSSASGGPNPLDATKFANLYAYTPPDAPPNEMQVQQSYEVRVILTSRSGILLSNFIDKSSYATPVGTVGATLGAAFGTGYEPFATAAFAASNFDHELLRPEQQPLTRSFAEWDWNVTPKHPGEQTLSVEITLEWLPTSTNTGSVLPPPTYPIWQKDIPVLVTEPTSTPVPTSTPLPVPTSTPPPGFITPGQFNIGQILVTLTGAAVVGLSGLAIRAERRRRIKRRRIKRRGEAAITAKPDKDDLT